MSDVTQGAEAEAPAKQTVVNVPITKAKGTIPVVIEDIPADVWAEVILQGLKVLYNRGQSKITKASTKDEAELKKLAMEAAAKQHELVMTSKIKFTGGKAKSGVSGKVMTEAMRLARNLVKDEIKKSGGKVSHVEASEITRVAKLLLAAKPEIITKAEANLKEREAIPVAGDIMASIKVSDKLVKKDAEKKAKDQLSKTQAGKVAVRAKGKPAQATAH